MQTYPQGATCDRPQTGYVTGVPIRYPREPAQRCRKFCGTVRARDGQPSGAKAQVRRWWRFDTTVNGRGEVAADAAWFAGATAKLLVGRWCQFATTVTRTTTSSTAGRGRRLDGVGNFPRPSPRECGAADSTEPPRPGVKALVARFRQFAGTVTPTPTCRRAGAYRGRVVAVLIVGFLRSCGRCQ